MDIHWVADGPEYWTSTGEITFMVVGTKAWNVHFLMSFEAPNPYGVLALWNVPGTTLTNPKWVFPK